MANKLKFCITDRNAQIKVCGACERAILISGDIIISNGVTLTVDSDLSGTSPQFTLTCISTGGPATTVTWTRDSGTVTEGTESVLDDRETAQYTHTLTVAGRLGGLYTCTVANDKPSEAGSNITIQGVYNMSLRYIATRCVHIILLIQHDHCL